MYFTTAMSPATAVALCTTYVMPISIIIVVSCERDMLSLTSDQPCAEKISLPFQ